MRWWKVGILASIGWLLLMVALTCAMMWYVVSHPMGEHVDAARSEKAGQIVGMLGGIGLAAIWWYAVLRLKKRSNESAGPMNSKPHGK